MADRSLNDLQRQHLSKRLFRVAVVPAGLPEVAAQDGLTAEQIKELLPLDFGLDVLTSPFRQSLFRQPSRFSDGSFPVFYSAEELETARLEKAHHVGKQLAGQTKTECYGQFSCQFLGYAKDLVPLRTAWADLTADDYATCQRLAREAVSAGLDALRSPSARHSPDGVCLPVFVQNVLSGPQFLGLVEFSVDADGVSTKVLASGV